VQHTEHKTLRRIANHTQHNVANLGLEANLGLHKRILCMHNLCTTVTARWADWGMPNTKSLSNATTAARASGRSTSLTALEGGIGFNQHMERVRCGISFNLLDELFNILCRQ
jgi:hypothetical protein